MLLFYTDRFRKSHAQAPESVRRAFSKQARLLEQDLRHPSLRAKKYGGTYGGEQDVWQARVDRRWRFYFRIHGENCTLLDLTPHPK